MPRGPISRQKTPWISSISRWTWPSVWRVSINQWQQNVEDPVCLQNHNCMPTDHEFRMQGLYLKCSMIWLATCPIIMRRLWPPDARGYTAQGKHMYSVTNATSTFALCHTETASKLLIANERICGNIQQMYFYYFFNLRFHGILRSFSRGVHCNGHEKIPIKTWFIRNVFPPLFLCWKGVKTNWDFYFFAQQKKNQVWRG